MTRSRVHASIGACRSAYFGLRGPERRHLPPVFAALALLVAVLLFALIVCRDRLSPSIRWPLEGEHALRMSIATFVILIPPLVAILGMWLGALHAFALVAQDRALVRANIALYLQARQRVH